MAARTCRALGLALVLAAGLGGCVTYTGKTPTPQTHLEIVLKENDFKTVKQNLKGRAKCTYVLGLIPIEEPNLLSKCLAQIREQAKMDGRPVQLVNYTKDEVVTNYLFLVRQHSMVVTADLIEFDR